VLRHETQRSLAFVGFSASTPTYDEEIPRPLAAGMFIAGNAMRLYPIALTAGLLPLVTIHACYLWAAINGHVDWCIPYIHSCTSISAAGRTVPEFYLFKALMIPTAVILSVYWVLCSYWLTRLRSGTHKVRKTLPVLGFVSCAGLILYSVMLGEIGDLFRLQRQIGVSSFFGLTYIAQLLVTWQLGKIPGFRQRYPLELRSLEYVALLILLVGIGSVALSVVASEVYHRTDNAFEWNFTLMLCVHILLTGLLWRKTCFSAHFQTGFQAR